MKVLNLTGLHIQLDWYGDQPPTLEQLADLGQAINEAMFKLGGEPCLMGDPSDWTATVADDGIPQVSDLISHVEVVA